MKMSELLEEMKSAIAKIEEENQESVNKSFLFILEEIKKYFLSVRQLDPNKCKHFQMAFLDTPSLYSVYAKNKNQGKDLESVKPLMDKVVELVQKEGYDARRQDICILVRHPLFEPKI